ILRVNDLSRPPVVNQVLDILFFFTNREIFKQRPKPCKKNRPDINGLSVTRDGLVLMSLRTTSGVIAVDKESGKVIWHAGPEVVA
ncbi:hypothetical protein MJL27_27235, partial [Salmonella enterica subsp. enterica serovar Anatum]|nr:hypothetical protein [Salmonella enterica subsp. enterica serovar Anatum]